MNSRFIATRLLQVIPTVLVIVLVGFLLIHIAPGDPLLVIAGEHGDAAYYAAMREHFGLDQSLWRQLSTYFVRVASGDFGFSYVQGRATGAVIMDRVPATLLLTATALVFALLVGIPLGALAARHPHSRSDVAISALALALHSAPVFWIAQILMITLALGLGLFPVQGMMEAASDATGARHLLDVLRHLALPALVLAAAEVAALVRLTRSGFIDELARDHVRTARAKGAGEWSVFWRHAFPRTLLPILTVIGGRVGHLLAGAVLVEVVFGWPGMGRLLYASLQARDQPVLLGIFFVVALTVVLANLATDLTHAIVDPRIALR